MSEFLARTVFAALPVSDLMRAVDWYARVFGRNPDGRPAPEIAEYYLALDRVPEHGTLQLHEDVKRAGGGLATINVDDMSAVVCALGAVGVILETKETPLYADTVSAVTVGTFDDLDGNALTVVQPHLRDGR